MRLRLWAEETQASQGGLLHQRHPVFQEAAEGVGPWACGGATARRAEQQAGNQGAASQPELRGPLSPDGC